MNKSKKLIAGLICSQACLMGVATQANAANWLKLQGTEKSDSAPRAKVWGFVQAQYQKDNSAASSSGKFIAPKLIGPNLTSQQQFNINRARIGVRGVGFPLDSSINYFVLLEMGNNGITGGGPARVTDASITINKLPGARIRVGQFKTPGAEEGLQAIHVFDYINFTNASNQLLLERSPTATYTANAAATATPNDGTLTAFNGPVSAFRDTGVQVFDSFKMGDWEHSYAVMFGNGNGLGKGDNDGNLDTYTYWASEKTFSGKGPRAKTLKLFAWNQSGKRLLDNTNDSTSNATEFNRSRSGLGVKYSKNAHRVTFEYITAKGMIFVGPDKPTFDINGSGAGGDGSNGKASGYYLDYGYSIPNTKFQIDARYDVLNRLEGDKFEFAFKTATLGLNYHFNKKSRLTVNYENRSVNAINFASNTGPNANLDGVDSRFSIQVTHLF